MVYLVNLVATGLRVRYYINIFTGRLLHPAVCRWPCTRNCSRTVSLWSGRPTPVPGSPCAIWSPCIPCGACRWCPVAVGRTIAGRAANWTRNSALCRTARRSWNSNRADRRRCLRLRQPYRPADRSTVCHCRRPRARPSTFPAAIPRGSFCENRLDPATRRTRNSSTWPVKSRGKLYTRRRNALDGLGRLRPVQVGADCLRFRNRWMFISRLILNLKDKTCPKYLLPGTRLRTNMTF